PLPGFGVASTAVTLLGNNEPDTATDTDNRNGNLTVDFGFWDPTIGDQLWHDVDNDGVYEPNLGETGIPNVIVNLYRDDGDGVLTPADGAPLATLVTDPDGRYVFDHLAEGDYIVQIDPINFTPGQPLAGYVSSTGNDVNGSAPDPDSDVNNDDNGNPTPDLGVVSKPVTLITDQEPITDGDDSTNSNLSVDFGFYALVMVGDRVWYDNDGDGQQDDPIAEPGVNGVVVTLYDATTDQPVLVNGNPLTATTNSDGLYLFVNLAPGDYYVVFNLTTLPTGYVVTQPNAGGVDEASDSDGDPTTGQTRDTGSLSSGQKDLNLDLGIYAPVSVGDRVWLDTNVNGGQDDPIIEPGVAGVAVTLYNAATDQPVQSNGNALTDTTDATGLYLFDNLPPGDYYVVFNLSTLPAGHVVTVQDASGVGENADSDANPSTGQTRDTGFLPGGGKDLNLDLGVYQPASLGDYVWHDLDADGIQEAGEPPLQGVLVTLFRGNGTPTGLTTLTNAEGFYSFNGLTPGDYYVQFTPPAGMVATKPNGGLDDTLDSDSVSGRTVVTTLSPGENDPTWDAGFTLPAAIGNYVWLDSNKDGLKNNNEPGVEGITVKLYDVQGNLIGTKVTDSQGFFEFTNLTPGDYYLEFSRPAKYLFTTPGIAGDYNSDVDIDTGRTVVTTLTPGENDPSWGAGLVNEATGEEETAEPGRARNIFLPLINR
nr:carboxypeptidase regulatory-like domain-containing protein [bacterium]